MALFPNSLPVFIGFIATHTLLTDVHAAQHNLEQAEIVNIATKIGTGASTPTSGTVLRGNGTGTSTWGQVALATDVTGVLPIANGGTNQTSLSGLTIPNAALANPTISGTVTGSGTYTTPTLTTPAITDFTSATHDHSSNSKGGQLSSTAFITGAVLTKNLDLSAMGIISSTSTSASFNAGTATDIDTLVMTIPTGCTKVYIFGSVRLSAGDLTLKDIQCWIDYDAATSITKSFFYTTNFQFASSSVAVLDSLAVTSGSHTFKLRASASAGATGGTVSNRTIFIVPVAA